MKKTILLLLAGLMAVGISACGNTDTKQQANNHYENFEQPSIDDINYAIEDAEAKERVEKYSDSEYEKITLNAFVPKEGVKDFFVQDLDGNEVNWARDEVDTKVEFYIPTELVGSVTYDDNNTMAFVTINASTSNQGNFSNCIDVYPLQLEISIARDGYQENGTKYSTLEDDEEFYNSIANNRFSDKTIVEPMVNSGIRGTAKMIYKYVDGDNQHHMVAIRDTALSPKLTACFEISAYDDFESNDYGQQYAYSITETNPEILYEVLDSIQVELIEQSE